MPHESSLVIFVNNQDVSGSLVQPDNNNHMKNGIMLSIQVTYSRDWWDQGIANENTQNHIGARSYKIAESCRADCCILHWTWLAV